VRREGRADHLSIPSRIACKSVTESLNTSASPSVGTVLQRNSPAVLRSRLSVMAAIVGFPVSRETKCRVKVSELEGPCVSISQLSLSDAMLHIN
jgi:hypothetical protein